MRQKITPQIKQTVVEQWRTLAAEQVNEITELFHANYLTEQGAKRRIEQITYDLEFKIRNLDRLEYIDV